MDFVVSIADNHRCCVRTWRGWNEAKSRNILLGNKNILLGNKNILLGNKNILLGSHV